MKYAPHILICESHNASISAMPNSLHNIVSKGIAREIFMSHTETITCLPQIITLRGCEEKYGRSKGYKDSTLMQAL